MALAIALDLSLKPGYAIFSNDQKNKPKDWPHEWYLLKSGTLFQDKTHKDFGAYPESYLLLANYTVNKIFKLMREEGIDESGNFIIVEETTVGSNNYSQKILEFLHYSLINSWMNMSNVLALKYVRTGSWKAMVGAHQTKEEKSKNAKIARIKKKTGAKLARGKDGKILGRVTRKHVSVRVANSIFGLKLKLKDNDTADAIGIAHAFLNMACPEADGTLEGGIFGKN
jgi:hypothetical protein